MNEWKKIFLASHVYRKIERTNRTNSKHCKPITFLQYFFHNPSIDHVCNSSAF